MWGRQPCSPRRNYQSLPSSGYSATLPKLFLHPSTNPNFSGNQFTNSPTSSTRRSFQYSSSNPPSPTIHSRRFSAAADLSITPIELSQQNFKFSPSNNYKPKDINVNMYQSKNIDELSFDGGKPYAASFIYFNYRHFLTSIEEKEIRNYTEIFYLRRKPKKRKLINKKNRRFSKNKIDSPDQPSNEQTYCESNNFPETNNNNSISPSNPNCSLNLNESSKNDVNDICSTIKSKISEDLNNNAKLSDTAKSPVANIEDKINDEFPIGDHVAYRYEILSKIGYGAFGVVLKCYDHKMLQDVALKMIKDTHENHPEIVLEAKFLENLQNGCKQHHICEIYESFTFRNYFCISMEFINSNFESKIDQKIRDRLSNSDLLQLFDAAQFIHSNGIIHCDIKPSNILFEIDNKSTKPNKPNSATKRSKDDSDGIVQTNSISRRSAKSNRRNLSLNKINDNIANNRNYTFHTRKKGIRLIDFGCSCYIGKCPYVKIQSLNYRSPEVILRLMPYTAAIDVWSIGCVIFEATVGSPLFNSNSERELIKEIVELIGEPPAWMIEGSPRASKFFIKIGGELRINTKISQCNSNDDDDLIKNSRDKKNIRSPINSTQSSNASTCIDDDLIKNYGDLVSKSGNSIENSETNFKVCSPTSKNTTVRKNRIGKSNFKVSPLRARISSVGNPLLLSLLEGCLTWDPRERLSSEQLLNHPWSRSIK